MKRRTTAWLLLPILCGAGVADAAGKRARRAGKTPPNVVVTDRAGVKRRLPILKSYPESLWDGDPKGYISRIAFVPDGSGRLKRMAVRNGYPGPTTAAEHFTERMVEHALSMLLDAAPHRFPRGSSADYVDARGTLLRVSLNRAFARQDFWRSELRARAALYAIVNTAVENGPYVNARRVQILIEGKPVARLGRFSTSGPLTPRLNLVAGP